MPGKKQIGVPLGVGVPEHPGDHAQDFAHRWRDKLEEYVTVRMEELGIPIEMIGQPDYDGDGRWHAFDPYGRKGGANTTGVVVDSGVLNPDLLKERLKERPCHRNHIHMRAEANETKASWTGPSRSVRNRSLRKLCSHDKVRSATQR